MILDALLITSISLCTVSDSDRFQDGNGMLDAATASWLELRLMTQRRRKRSPGAAPRQVLPSGERNRSDPHITPGLSDNVEPS